MNSGLKFSTLWVRFGRKAISARMSLCRRQRRTRLGLGQSEDAEWDFYEALMRQPDFSLLRKPPRAPYAKTGDTLRYMSGLKAEAKGSVNN